MYVYFIWTTKNYKLRNKIIFEIGLKVVVKVDKDWSADDMEENCGLVTTSCTEEGMTWRGIGNWVGRAVVLI